MCRLTSVTFDSSVVVPADELEEGCCLGGSLVVEEFWWLGRA